MVAVAVASYAKDLEIVVFNGHVHTTELYVVDGVKYLLLGGGGAEQDPILPGRTAIKVPAGYPADLYWKGQPPKEEYNYLLVDVQPGQKTSSHSIVSDRGRLSRSQPWKCSSKSAALWRCPLLAQSGHFTTEFQCPLLGVKRSVPNLIEIKVPGSNRLTFDAQRGWRPRNQFRRPLCLQISGSRAFRSWLLAPCWRVSRD